MLSGFFLTESWLTLDKHIMDESEVQAKQRMWCVCSLSPGVCHSVSCRRASGVDGERQEQNPRKDEGRSHFRVREGLDACRPVKVSFATCWARA